MIPQTKSVEVTNHIHDLLKEGHYVDVASSFSFHRLKREVDELIKVDPVNGYLNLALLLSLQGDYSAVLKAWKNSVRLNGNLESAAHKSLFIYVSAQLGYFSEAYQKFSELCGSGIGFENEEKLLDYTNLTGAYQDCYSFIEKVRDSGWGVISEKTREQVFDLKNILDDTNTYHGDILKLLDCAGAIFRQHKLLPINVFSSSASEESMIVLTLGLLTSVDEIVEMNMELADLVAQQLQTIPSGFHVRFSKAGGVVHDRG